MLAQIWNGRVAIVISLLYGAIVTQIDQSIEFYRFLLTEEQSFQQLIWSFVWPSFFASSCFLASILISNLEELNSVDRSIAYHPAIKILAPALTAIPFLAAALGTLDASTNLNTGVQATAKVLVWTLVLMAAVSALVVYALIGFISAKKLPSIFQRSTAFVVSLTGLLVFIGISISPLFVEPSTLVSFSQSIGPLGLIALFCGLISLLLSGLVLATRGTRIPGIALVVLFAVVLSSLGLNDNHAIRAEGELPDENFHVLDVKKFKDWLVKRADKDEIKNNEKPYPVFVVAAQGGGIYAAYHTAAVLAQIEDTWPQFSQHLFAVSSVSGGSLGSAYHVATSRALQKQKNNFCGSREVTRRDLVDRFFANDFLSPALFMSLFPDFAQRFWIRPIPSFDRALGLEYAIEEAWTKLALECEWAVENSFKEGLTKIAWTPEDLIPALFFNTTDEQSGRLVAISNIRKTKGLTSVWEMGLDRDLNLSTATVLSARFPYITPFGWFEGEQLNWYAELEPIRVYLGDGGYYDNSGADLLVNLSLVLKNLAARTGEKVKFYSIIIGDAGFASEYFIHSVRDLDRPSTPPDVAKQIRRMLKGFKENPPEPIGSTTRLETWSPIKALMGSRQSRSKESIKHLMRINGLNPWQHKQEGGQIPKYSLFNDYNFVFPLGSNTSDLPLGWMLSRYTRDRLALRTGKAIHCTAGRYPDFKKPTVNVLGTFIGTYQVEGFQGAVDSFVAACSLDKLLSLGGRAQIQPNAGNAAAP